MIKKGLYIYRNSKKKINMEGWLIELRHIPYVFSHWFDFVYYFFAIRFL